MKSLIFYLFIILPSILFSDYIENFKCYPNPFSPLKEVLKASYSLRYNEESEVIIKIFTLNGDLVYEKDYPKGSGNITAGISVGTREVEIWNGKNNNGRYVSDGGYILQFIAIPSNGPKEVKHQKIILLNDK
jgi:flagellar hook assembly protein FlgD